MRAQSKRRLFDLQSKPGHGRSFTGWVRIQLPDVIKTRLISILMGAKLQLLEVVTGHSQFLSDFSIPQAIPTQPVTIMAHSRGVHTPTLPPTMPRGRTPPPPPLLLLLLVTPASRP